VHHVGHSSRIITKQQQNVKLQIACKLDIPIKCNEIRTDVRSIQKPENENKSRGAEANDFSSNSSPADTKKKSANEDC